MSTLHIRVENGQTEFLPGDALRGTVDWQLDTRAEALELRLFWYTSGKGDQDVAVVETRRFDSPRSTGDEEFEFILPQAPYSFAGKLISLHWSLELVALPGNEMARQPFTLSPTGQEIDLYTSLAGSDDSGGR